MGPSFAFHHISCCVFVFIFPPNQKFNFSLTCFVTVFLQMEPVTDAQLASNTLSATIMGGGNSSGVGGTSAQHHHHLLNPKTDAALSPLGVDTQSTSKDDDEDSSNAASSDCKSPGQRYVNLWSHRCVMVCHFSLFISFLCTIRIHVHIKLIEKCSVESHASRFSIHLCSS